MKNNETRTACNEDRFFLVVWYAFPGAAVQVIALHTEKDARLTLSLLRSKNFNGSGYVTRASFGDIVAL